MLANGKRTVSEISKPQQRKKEESERLRGESDQINFIDLRFERWEGVGFRKTRRRHDLPYLAADKYGSH